MEKKLGQYSSICAIPTKIMDVPSFFKVTCRNLTPHRGLLAAPVPPKRRGTSSAKALWGAKRMEPWRSGSNEGRSLATGTAGPAGTCWGQQFLVQKWSNLMDQ